MASLAKRVFFDVNPRARNPKANLNTQCSFRRFKLSLNTLYQEACAQPEWFRSSCRTVNFLAFSTDAARFLDTVDLLVSSESQTHFIDSCPIPDVIAAR